LEKFRILYLIGGILFLIVSLISGAWWELIGGGASKPVLYVGFSPFDFKAELLGSQIIKASPLMTALFLSERLLAIFGSVTIIAGSLLRGKTWSRRLLNLKPLTTPIGFGAIILIGAILAVPLVKLLYPYIDQVLPDLREALIPYASRYLTINLYLITHINGSIKVRIVSQFTINFWLALVAGALCLAGAIIRRRETRTELPPPPPPPA
jgi:hypothetical protein